MLGTLDNLGRQVLELKRHGISRELFRRRRVSGRLG
jgi:hypothetical protein